MPAGARPPVRSRHAGARSGAIAQSLLRLQHVIACIIGFLATAYLATRLWIRAETMDVAGETTAQLKLKIAYLTYGMAILMALTAIALLVLASRPPRRQPTGEV